MNNLFLRKTARLPVLAFVMALLCFSFVSKASVGQEKADAKPAKEKKPQVEMLECKVKVVDPDGFPVEDATVFCTGLRSKEKRSSHWGWNDDQFGDLPRIKTYSDGIAVMPYPKMLGEGKTTGMMTWSVEHPAFVNFREDRSVNGDPAEIMLERGFRIALNAIDAATGKRLTTNLHAVTSFEGGGSWKLKKNGTFVSSVMKKQDGILRIACFQDNAPTLFSEEIEVKIGDKSRLLLKDVKLAVGCRVEGKLDDSVSRPINNGKVIATLAKRSDLNERRTLSWGDEARVSADGTFVFESLPNNEVIQMIPICDDYVPAKPKPEDVLAALPGKDPKQVANKIEQFSATPQMVKTNGETVTQILKMTKASALTVKVVDQNGDPVPGVRVMSTAPNQYWFNFGSQILGQSNVTRKMWEMKEAGVDSMSYYQAEMHPYMLKTGKDGSVTFSSMPDGNHAIRVYEQEWQIEKDLVSGERFKRIQVHGSDQAITIKLAPKG